MNTPSLYDPWEESVFVTLVWLGQLPARIARSSACLFPSGESMLVCSDGVISHAFDHLELSLPSPLCPFLYITRKRTVYN